MLEVYIFGLKSCGGIRNLDNYFHQNGFFFFLVMGRINLSLLKNSHGKQLIMLETSMDTPVSKRDDLCVCMCGGGVLVFILYIFP